MKKLLGSILTIALVSVVAVGATSAYFSDTETSVGNTFVAGTLDLNVDGDNVNVVKFTVANMRPGNQPKGTYILDNVGSINGFLDLESINVANNENSCIDPETDAGDVTCDNPGVGQGELQDVVNMRMFLDRDCDGWIGGGDTTFFNGLTGTVAGNYELDEPINAGNNTCVTVIFDWWSTADDNKAMGDDMNLDMAFELAQTAGQ